MSKNLPLFPFALVRHLTCLLGLSIAGGSLAEVVIVRGEPLQTSEIQTLSPVCKLILIDMPGSHNGAGNRPLTQHAPLFEEPRYQLAKNNPHIHHYCWALVSKQRYFRERDKNKRKHYLSQFNGDIDYVLQHSDKSWPYFDVMLVEQGQMQMILGNFGAALAKADQALKYQPNSEHAYLLKTDAYKNMGNITAAIAAGKQGLEKNPDSTRLRKRLERLGQTVPPLAQRKPAAPENANPAVSEKGASDSAPASATPPAAEKADSEKTPPEPETIGTKNNPYCRFCP